MGLFSKNKSEKQEKITYEDEKRFKMRSQNVHDPILSAVNEAQPFETQANDHQRQSSSMSNDHLKDVFGTPIFNPDISNPSRARDERPLDTIRAFEYAITGDLIYKQQLETPTLGWRTRPDFPAFNSNPYDNQQQQQPQYDGYDQQPYYNSNNQQQQQQQQTVYSAPPPKEETTKKKKGLFGRKKK